MEKDDTSSTNKHDRMADVVLTAILGCILMTVALFSTYVATQISLSYKRGLAEIEHSRVETNAAEVEDLPTDDLSFGAGIPVIDDRIWINPVKSHRVIDGDTVYVLMDLGHSITVAKYDRIIGVDTPEKSTEAGRAVKAIVEKWCDDNRPLMAKYFREDKFGGRFDGELISGKTGETLSSYLILSGVARPYMGDAKKAWAETELTDVKLKANTILSPAISQ